MKKKYYYVYRITNLLDGKIYIGCHGTNDLDDGYMGSSKYLSKDIKELGVENFKKEIIYFAKNKTDMLLKEKQLVHKDFVISKCTYNRAIGGSHNTSGFAILKDEEGNASLVPVDDPRYLSGELVGVTKGMLTVKDVDGNHYLTSVDDPRYLSGELVHVSMGRQHKEETKRKIGAANSIYQKGSGNSQYGTCWVFNRELKTSIRIKKNELNDYLNNGWEAGRVIKEKYYTEPQPDINLQSYKLSEKENNGRAYVKKKQYSRLTDEEKQRRKEIREKQRLERNIKKKLEKTLEKQKKKEELIKKYTYNGVYFNLQRRTKMSQVFDIDLVDSFETNISKVRETLNRLYIIERKTLTQISELYKTSPKNISNYLESFHIDRRTFSEALKNYNNR